ncbi:MAG: thioredoxin domain-containing protein [Acidimicrobiia bacterium]
MNRLANESSPYLRQHRDNPVDWFPWGDEAFATARERDVPVLLSVGYSACHWCHVMAHESFEDPATAAVMNELFVNVKVDREERPDVDAVYMEALQAMTGGGGWPMTVFLDHDARPFHAGTYFPPRATRGMPGFVDVLRAADEAWRERRPALLEHAGELTGALDRPLGTGDGTGDLPGAAAVLEGAAAVLARVDARWGGLGGAPKFPQTMAIELLLRAHDRSGDADLLAAARLCLDAMAAGGIADHLGGGFARYSVDDRWLVPHFEKMLYDQALLARVYLHGWQVTGDPAYRQVLDDTVGYVLRDLRSPGGGLCSAEDADSEGVEGRFYVWSLAEVLEVAGPEAAAWWRVTEGGNFEGANILFRPRGEPLVRPPSIEAARRALFERREGRVRPGLDDKVLAEWNGLFLATLAEAAAATGTAEWLAAAEEIGEFLVAELLVGGRWHRSWQADTGARHLAVAADHAALVDAFTRLAEATGRAVWLDRAAGTADALLDLFWDDADGCLFTTGHDAERLVARQKDVLDGATPSANSMAAVGLARLGALTGVARYGEAADGILRRLGPLAAKHPTAFAHLLAAADLGDDGREVVVTGDRPDLLAAVQARYLPRTVLAWGERTASPLWEGRPDPLPGDRGRAYVCQGYACRLPVDTPDALLAQLG